MAEDKFIIRPKRTYGENTVVSCRMPVEMVAELKMQEQIKQDAQQAQSIVEQRDISIENNLTIPVQVMQKLDDKDVKKLTKDISQYTITELNDSFIKRGKYRINNPLKPM